MDNQFTGDVDLQMGGKSLKVHFDWDAVGMLQTEFGEEFDEVVTLASVKYHLPVLAKVLSVGLELHHPGKYSPESIMKMSPPVILVIDTIDKALSYAFNGGMEGSEEKSSDPKNPILRYLKKILWDWWHRPSGDALNMA